MTPVWLVGRDRFGLTHLVVPGRGHRAICGQVIRSVVIGGTAVTCPDCAAEDAPDWRHRPVGVGR